LTVLNGIQTKVGLIEEMSAGLISISVIVSQITQNRVFSLQPLVRSTPGLHRDCFHLFVIPCNLPPETMTGNICPEKNENSCKDRVNL
jgi:hypothetical protein